MSDLSIRTISADEHAAYIASQPAASFLQTPGWAAVKSEWKAESLGWYDSANPAELVGVGRSTIYRTIDRMRPKPVDPERPVAHIVVPPFPNTEISTPRNSQPSH